MKIIKYSEFLNELKKTDLSGTYLTQREEDLSEITNDIIQKNKLDTPKQKGDEQFIKMRKTIMSDPQIISFFRTDDELLDNKWLKKWVENFIITTYLNKNTKSKQIINYDDLDFKLLPEYSPIYKQPKYKNIYKGKYQIWQIIFPKEVEKYIEENPEFNKLDKYCYITLEIENFNRFHFPGRQVINWDQSQKSGLPSSIKGKGIGYNTYLKFIQKVGWITTSTSSSEEARKVWKKLCTDENLKIMITNHDIISFSNQFKGDVNKIIKEYIQSKFITNDKIVIDPKLEKELGDWFKEWKSQLKTSNYYYENKDKLIKKNKNIKLTDEDFKSIINGELRVIVWIPKFQKCGIIKGLFDNNMKVNIQDIQSDRWYTEELKNINILDMQKIKN